MAFLEVLNVAVIASSGPLLQLKALRFERCLRCVWIECEISFEVRWHGIERLPRSWEDEDWKTGTYHLTRSTL